MPGWIKTVAVQSDPRLCCNHPGEFVIFFMFFICSY